MNHKEKNHLKITEQEFEIRAKQVEDNLNEDAPSYEIVNTYKDLYNLAKKADLDPLTIEQYRKDYLFYLLEYGYEYKKTWEDSGKTAQRIFLEALGVDEKLPLAHYRLGYIYFKINHIGEAINHFYKALTIQEKTHNNQYSLEESQNIDAQSMLNRCIARINAMIGENKSPLPVKENILSSDGYSIYGKEGQIKMYVFSPDNKKSQKLISEGTYHQYKDEILADHQSLCIDLLPDFPIVGTNKKISSMNLLTLKSILSDRTQYGENKRSNSINTINKRISRLRDFFEALGIPHSDLSIKKEPGKPPIISKRIYIYFFCHPVDII